MSDADAAHSASDTRDLVSLAKQGNRDAANELFRRYYPRVLRQARRRLGPRMREILESRDIVQDALMDAARSLDAFEMTTESALIDWLARIVEHRIIRQVKRHSAKKRDANQRVSLDRVLNRDATAEPSLAPASIQTSPLSKILRGESDEAIRQCFPALPEKYQGIIVHRVVHEETWEEVAREVGSPSPGAARNMYRTAIGELKRLLRARQRS